LIRKIILTSLFLSIVFTEEIWNKKIPPSNYLKKFSIVSEKENDKSLKYTSYSLMLIGAAIVGNKNSPIYAEIIGTLSFITGGIGALITQIRSDKPKTPAGKEYKKIKNIKNEKNKEIKAYDALVRLSENSRLRINSLKKHKKQNDYNNKKTNALNFILNKIIQANETNILENDSKKIILTKEEKLLNYYLNQVPINKIFN